MKIHIRALSVSFALLWGGLIFLVGLVNLLAPSYGKAFLELASSIYPGYKATSSFGQVIIGTLYGLVDGFIGGLVLGWLYNLFVPRAQSESV